jgi:hypothetical protein
MVKILDRNEYGLLAFSNILQTSNVLTNVDSAFAGYYNVYHLLNDFMNGTVYCFGCYSSKDMSFPDGIVWCMLDGNGYMECHLGFKHTFPIVKKIECLQKVIDLIHEFFPECKGIVGYPPKHYRHVRLLLRRLKLKESECNIKFFDMDNNQSDCVKVTYDFLGGEDD